jgi:hypothetical protein
VVCAALQRGTSHKGGTQLALIKQDRRKAALHRHSAIEVGLGSACVAWVLATKIESPADRPSRRVFFLETTFKTMPKALAQARVFAAVFSSTKWGPTSREYPLGPINTARPEGGFDLQVRSLGAGTLRIP